jgi:hypothetical protein
MAIEIRELVIRSEVLERCSEVPAMRPNTHVESAALQRIKAEVLASCREWLRDQLQRQQER